MFIPAEKSEKARQYWLNKLSGELNGVRLCADFPFTKYYEAVKHKAFFGEGHANDLIRMSKNNDLSLYVILLTAFLIIIYRYNNQNDFVLISPTYAVIEQNHNNWIALKNYVHPEMTFKELLMDVNDTVVNGYKNQYYPFRRIIDSLGIKNYLSLFRIILALENIHRIDSLKDIINDSGNDITFSFRKDGNKIGCSIIYNSKLFKRESIEKLFACYSYVLIQAATSTAVKIADIEIISEQEKKQLLYEFNSAADYPKRETIHRLFVDQAGKNPDGIALIGSCAAADTHHLSKDDRQQITYRDLDNESNRLANLLLFQGVQPGVIAAIMLERSIGMVIGILGILKAGGAYLPIDPDYPRQRVEYILADSGARILVTTGNLKKKVDNLRNIEFGTLFIEEPGPGAGARRTVFTEQELRGEPCVRPSGFSSSQPLNISSSQPLSSPETPAYIIYTSGSTGRPKGVIVEHWSVINLLYALQKKYPVDETDAYLLKTSYIFDVSVTELFGWYMAGGRLVILEKGGEKDPKKIIAAIEKTAVTHINFIPAMFNAFAAELTRATIHKLASLKYIFLAGEALLPELVRKFRCFDTGIALENIYGPTEATVYACNFSLSRWQDEGNVPIGKPMQNINIYILNKYNRLQPIGAAGELCIAGHGLARGYLNRPELTAEKFVKAQAFSIQPSQGIHMSHKSYKSYLYKTGDLACWLPDGNIEFLGRIDQQVKIRGFRVELGEIESLLIKHEMIRDAVVIVRENQSGNKYLCAYFVPEKKETSAIPGMREYLAAKLPPYMIPSHFAAIESIPLTQSGKADKKNLPDLTGTRPTLAVTYVAPKSNKEKIIAETWKEVLGLDKVGIHDNFFEIGGTSMDIIKVQGKISEILGKDFDVVKLFEYATISSFANYLNRDETNANLIDVDHAVELEIRKRTKMKRQEIRKRSRS